MITSTEKNVPSLLPELETDDLSGYTHRLAMGVIGLALPFTLWLIAGWRPTQGLPAWEPLGSISAYFYTGASPAFSGALIALAVFFFTYRGYGNDGHFYDRLAAIIAGTAAVLVVFFPTSSPGDLPAPLWWVPLMKTIHFGAAVALFGSFAFFSLFLFRKSKAEKNKLPRGKMWRNRFYALFGGAITASILWLIIALVTGAPIFWPETLALVFFALSWLLKGRLDRVAVVASKRALHYGRHPRHLLEDTKNVVQASMGNRKGSTAA